jgi:HlyD family secretion protein
MKIHRFSLSPARLATAVVLALLPWCAQAETLSALGRVLPRSGIVDVGGIAGNSITEIKVKEGDWVEAGQSLARLSSYPAAAKRVTQAEADLAATRAGTAKDIAMARQRVSASESQVTVDQERLERAAAARTSEFVSPDQYQERSMARMNSGLKLDQAKLDLEKITRDSDKLVRAAEADLEAARAQLALTEVQSPVKARVLKVMGRAGGMVERELFKLGDTSSMIVVVEVYEADVLKVKPGQKATISSAAFPAKMTGSVTSVSSLVFRNGLESIDPTESARSRIVEATVRMDKAEPLDRLVLLQVDVVLDL